MHPRDTKAATVTLSPDQIETVRIAESGLHCVGAARIRALPGYETLASVLDEALEQAQGGKGKERHATAGESCAPKHNLPIGAWRDSTAFAIGQACKKSIESSRLPSDRARRELLGAINYLAAAVIQIDRRDRK